MPASAAQPSFAAARRSERSVARLWRARLISVLRAPGAGSALVIAFALAVVGVSLNDSGFYARTVATDGAVPDQIARAAGLGIDAVTITGAHELSVKDILSAAGIDERGSLLFADAAAMRDRLLKLPIVKEASVRKLFPDRLEITLVERQPYALWQQDGAVYLIAADGTPIDRMRGESYVSLPFVVGPGANAHIADFVKLLDSAGDLRNQIRAGVFVGDRRWDLVLQNGMQVRLPEADPQIALAQLVRLADQSDLLQKDVLTLDMRMPGRLEARISEDAAADRAERLAHKHAKGGPT